MRKIELFVVVPLLIVPLALWQCSGQTAATPSGGDSGPEASTGDDDALGDDSLGDDSGPTINCSIHVDGPMNPATDPVSLCFQKQVLEAIHSAAFTPTHGVAASWNSSSLQPTTDGGTVLHDWRDDAAYGSAIADYLSYASKYGDNQIFADISEVLTQLAVVLESELATLPDEYDGTPYMHLRNIVGGLNFVSDTTDAANIAAIADAYGAAIATTYVHTVGPGDMIVGRCSSPGVCTYETEKAATAALALLDLAWRATFTDAGIPVDIDGSDEGTAPAALTTAATSVLAHLANHAASPSGMYYRALVTGGGGADGGSDGGATSGDTPVVLDAWPADVLLSEVQATTLFALLRAAALVTAQPVLSAASNYPFFDDANAIYAGMHGTPSLWDATKGGYFEGYSPSIGALYTDKPSGANATMYGALAYDVLENAPGNIEAGAPEVTELDAERTLLTAAGAVGTGLIAVIDNQTAFFRASSASFGLADSYEADGGLGGTEPGASNYTAAATTTVLEGLSAQAFDVGELQ